jgi:hypothetical protein
MATTLVGLLPSFTMVIIISSSFIYFRNMGLVGPHKRHKVSNLGRVMPLYNMCDCMNMIPYTVVFVDPITMRLFYTVYVQTLICQGVAQLCVITD